MKRVCNGSAWGFLCIFPAVAGLLLVVISTSSSAAAQTMVLPGKFNVTSLGSASFSIPISAPPGSGGLVPSLSLDYVSGGGAAVAGFGWRIDGLPSITRCPPTLAQDGYFGSVTYDVGIPAGNTDNDRFCLDGQRLVAISGNYGADGTEYRTEIESFSRIISHGYTGSSPSYFDVYTRSGRILEFGDTTDSRAMFANTSAFPSARAWLLDRISDASGNYLTVRYTVNPDTNLAGNSEVVPAEVDYTGNSNTGTTPYNKVTFVYGTLSDIIPAYADGNSVDLSQFLTDIKTWTGTQAAPGSSEVNDYKLGYTASPAAGSERALLTSAAICDGTGSNCLPPRGFTYQSDPGGNLFSMVQSSAGGSLGNPPAASWIPITGDFVGNGRTDFAMVSSSEINVFLSNGDGTFTNTTESDAGANFGSITNWTPVIGDFNGDGKTDFLLIDGAAIDVFISQGNGNFSSSQQNVSTSFGNPVTTSWTPIVGDFNGDKKTDFALMSGSTIDSFLSNGNGTFTQSTQTLYTGFGTPPSATRALIVGDFNGNGLTDFALVDGTSIDVFNSFGNGSFGHTQQTASTNFGSPPTASWTPITGDFNGDGLTDFALMSGSTIDAFLSNGNNSFTPVTQTLYTSFGTPPTASRALITGDFNGDGLTDFALIDGTAIDIFSSFGTGSFAHAQQISNVNFGSPPTAAWQPINGDFNGDGQADFLLAGGSSIYTFLSNDIAPDLLTSITNGIGASTSIGYGTPSLGLGVYYGGWSNSSSNACYANRANNAYPATSIDIAPAFPVVKTVSSTNGIGGNYSSTYWYSCALADTTGRGFLGFANQGETDQQTGVQENTAYSQKYPFVGQIILQTKSVVVNGSTVTLESTPYAYGALSSSTNPALPWNGTQAGEVAPQFPYVSSSVDTRNDLNGAALPTTTTTYTYDAFGDPRTVAISKVLGTTQGPTQTTTNTYWTNTTSPSWIVGRLTQSQVVSTTP